jgi:Derlin-2/3
MNFDPIGGDGGGPAGNAGRNPPNAQDIFSWYNEIPVISRLYLTAAVGTTTACFMDFVSPLTLYYNYDLIMTKHQYWRIISSFLFFGSFSLDFLFHLYFVVRYCRLLEEGPFRGRTADFIFMLILCACTMIGLAIFVAAFGKIKFLGHPLAFMMVYLWARAPEQRHVRMSLLGLFPFNAPYLPWVLLLFSLFIGNPIETDFLGIIVGHIYYFFDQVYPRVAVMRGWTMKKIIVTPTILHFICGSQNEIRDVVGIIQVEEEEPLLNNVINQNNNDEINDNNRDDVNDRLDELLNNNEIVNDVVEVE